MLTFLPVSSRRLHRRRLFTSGAATIPWPATVGGATLLPMFDRAGKVRRVMLLESGSPQIWFFDPEKVRLKIGLWGPIRLEAAIAVVRPPGKTQLRLVRQLWHFDPWWLLADERYRGQRAVEALKETNCAGRFDRSVRSVLFRRDLSQLSWVVVRKGSGYELERFRSEMLPERKPRRRRPPKPASLREEAGPWRLDPIWTRPQWLKFPK